MKILEGEGYAVHIYDEDHPPPHCHIIYADKKIVVAGLPFLNALYGGKVDRKLKRFLNDNLEFLTTEWDARHPKRNKN